MRRAPGEGLSMTVHLSSDEQAKVGLRDAAQGFSALVRRVRAGATIVITVNGKEAAQLCPVVPRIDAKGEA